MFAKLTLRFIRRLVMQFGFRKASFLSPCIQSHIQHIFLLFIIITSLILTNCLNWMANCHLNDWWLKETQRYLLFKISLILNYIKQFIAISHSRRLLVQHRHILVWDFCIENIFFENFMCGGEILMLNSLMTWFVTSFLSVGCGTEKELNWTTPTS